MLSLSCLTWFQVVLSWQPMMQSNVKWITLLWVTEPLIIRQWQTEMLLLTPCLSLIMWLLSESDRRKHPTNRIRLCLNDGFIHLFPTASTCASTMISCFFSSPLITLWTDNVQIWSYARWFFMLFTFFFFTNIGSIHFWALLMTGYSGTFKLIRVQKRITWGK